jgi:hypothetical protein
MNDAGLIAKWETRAAQYDQVGALVNGATLCRAFLQDLFVARTERESRALSLADAAAWSGYSQAHLARLVKDGKLKTLRPTGSRGRLSFRQADLPRKPGTPQRSGAGVHELASRLGIRGKESRYG